MDLEVEKWNLLTFNVTFPENGSLSFGDLQQLLGSQDYVIDEDQYTRELITYCVLGIAGMTVCWLGLVGNLLSLTVIMNKKLRRSSTYSFLAALAASDSLLLVTSILLLAKDSSKPERQDYVWPGKGGLCNYLFPYIQPAACVFHVTSVWLTLAFTIDRYLMICHPLRAKTFCTVRNARKVIVCLLLGSLVYNLPRFLEYHVVEVQFPLTNRTNVACDLTAIGRDVTYRRVYHSWLNLLLVFAFPFVSLVVFNSFLVRAVVRSRTRARSLRLSVPEKRANDTTAMLLGIVAVFLVCQLPALVSRTIWAMTSDPSVTFQWIPLYTVNEIANFLIVLNSAINVIPYYFFGARFRKLFCEKFCCCFMASSRFQQHYLCPSLTSAGQSGRSSFSVGKLFPRRKSDSFPTMTASQNRRRRMSLAGALSPGVDHPQADAVTITPRLRSQRLTPAAMVSYGHISAEPRGVQTYV